MVKISLFFLVFFTLFAHAQTKKRIFILHSYSHEYSWTKLQHDNFVSTLQESCSSPLEISVEYLDTKRLKLSNEYQSFFLLYLQKKYEDYRPDAVYVTDDNALKFFLHYQAQLFSDTPRFFSGINDLSLAHTLDDKHYTGVYETKEIIPNIELIRQFSPQTREIWIVGDTSNTYRSIESDIRAKISHYPKHTFHFLSSSQIDEIMAKLPNSPKTFVLLTTIGELSDSKGHNLTLKESIAILKQKPNLILCSMEDAYVQGGVVGGFVTSGAKQGTHAAELLIRYFNGEPLKNISSVIISPNVYMFDRKALMKSRLILSEYIARDAVLLHDKKTFLERYQHIILNTFFIVLVLFLLFLLIVFFIALQKNAQLKKLEAALEERSDEVSILKEKLVLMEQAYE